MALAIHFDRLIREGKVKDYAEIARLGKVTRARVTQVMNLLGFSPDLQERLLTRRARRKSVNALFGPRHVQSFGPANRSVRPTSLTIGGILQS